MRALRERRPAGAALGQPSARGCHDPAASGQAQRSARDRRGSRRRSGAGLDHALAERCGAPLPQDLLPAGAGRRSRRHGRPWAQGVPWTPSANACTPAAAIASRSLATPRRRPPERRTQGLVTKPEPVHLGEAGGARRWPAYRWTHVAGARGAAPATSREPPAAAGARPAKRSRGLLRPGERADPVTVYRVIEAEKAAFPIAFLCRRLGGSHSGFYAWRHHPASTRGEADAALTTQIRTNHAASRGTYGAPRSHAELAAEQAIRCGRKRVARRMRMAGRVRGADDAAYAPRSLAKPVRQRRTWCSAASGRQHRTGCGWQTSPTSPPGKASSIW
jgi:hypothetical protein